MDRKRQSRIFVLGSYAVGMTAECTTFPKTGQTVRGIDFQMLHGGKGSNQAIAAARLGADVTFCTCLGCDALGDDAMKLFAHEKLHSNYVKRLESSTTGVGVVLLDKDGNNEIVICLGANNFFTATDVTGIEGAIAASDILLVQLEFNIEAIIRAIEIAHKNNVKVILNPAPFQVIPDSVIRQVDIITPNETEAQEMAGTSCYTSEIPKMLFEKYNCSVVVTLGSKGSYIKTKEFDELIPPYPLNPIDTTGAGDTFSGALAVAIGEGKNIKDATWFATKAAAFSVTKKGVVESLPAREEIDNLTGC